MARSEWMELYTMAEAARQINVSRQWMGELVSRGLVGTVTRGAQNKKGLYHERTYVSGRSLRAYAEAQLAQRRLDLGL